MHTHIYIGPIRDLCRDYIHICVACHKFSETNKARPSMSIHRWRQENIWFSYSFCMLFFLYSPQGTINKLYTKPS